MRMQEFQHSPEAAGWLAAVVTFFWKFMPGPLGALVMVAVDPPKSRTDLFWRLVCAFIASTMLGEVAFDMLRSFNLFSFLNADKRSHVAAVDFLVGGFGWFVFGGMVMLLKRFRENPLTTLRDAKDSVKP